MFPCWSDHFLQLPLFLHCNYVFVIIVAVADNLYGYATTSWYMAEAISHIELDTDKVTEEEMAKIEDIANQKIREATPVSIVEYEASDSRLKEVFAKFVYLLFFYCHSH